MKNNALPPSKLRAVLVPERIPCSDSECIPRNYTHYAPQERVMQALELGLHIKARGYNIYLVGGADLGRTYLLREYLVPRAKKSPTPPDLLYVYNFHDKDAPLLLSVAAGLGRKLKAALAKLLPRIQKEVARGLDRPSFAKEASSLAGKFQAKRDQILKKMNDLAGEKGFNLDLDPSGGMTLYPIVEGKRLNEEEFEQLEESLRNELKAKGDKLLMPISDHLRKLAKTEQSYLDEERGLERTVIEAVLKAVFDPLVEKFIPLCECIELSTFFSNLRTDILDNIDSVLPPDSLSQSSSATTAISSGHPHEGPPVEDLSSRFAINVFVDNGATIGAPIVVEDHPTLSNLMGCIEREAEMGALITDFTLIKAGTLHKANGGYLILHMDDMGQHPHAWEALLRALRSGLARIEDTGEEDTTKTKGLRPQPVPLLVKVILIGQEEIYEMLLQNDERFSKLFKIKGHFTEHMPRSNAGIRTYLAHIRRIIEAEGLAHFDREALAGLVDYGSRLIEDKQKLSLKFPLLREIMIEASAFATLAKKDRVDKAVLHQAIEARRFRSNLVEEAFLEEYDRRIIKVVTSGEVVGRVNGLSVSFYGDFEFGLPHQISCSVGVGSGGIVDLERDAQLGGPIHTKAMMILKGYLITSFAHNKPLVLTGSLGFEQNYVGIEGDSASGAELAALLSALSGVPIRLSLAFTGAVSQSGLIMAVGGVTRKVEGFFEVCKRHGLTGEQGVILPRDNIAHLLLNEEVVQAVADKRFHIYAVGHITEAMELLTGMPAGRLMKNGNYSKGSLYDKVDTRLVALRNLAEPLSKKRRNN